jgi:hypothetical protein
LTFLKGYIKNNQANKAVDLFNHLFNACAQLGTKQALNLVERLYKEMPKDFCSDPYLLTSLLDVFMKCGDVSKAQLLFDKIPKKVLPMYGVMMKGKSDYVSKFI